MLGQCFNRTHLVSVKESGSLGTKNLLSPFLNFWCSCHHKPNLGHSDTSLKKTKKKLQYNKDWNMVYQNNSPQIMSRPNRWQGHYFVICKSVTHGISLHLHILSAEGGRRPSEPLCKVIFENEQQDPTTPNKPPGAGGRRRSLVSSEPQHVTLIVFGIGMVNRTHLEADIGGLTMEAELKKIHGSFTLKEKMKGKAEICVCAW